MRVKVLVAFTSLACLAGSAEAIAQSTVPPNVPPPPTTVPPPPATVPPPPVAVPPPPVTVPPPPPVVSPPPPAAGSSFDCLGLDEATQTLETDVTGCRKPQLNYQSLINTSTSIQNVIVKRLTTGPGIAEPAGLALSDPREIAERLASYGPIAITPTADLAAPAAGTPWNIWVDGKYSWQNDTSALSDLDGSLVNLLVGADYKVSGNLVLGIIGSYETSDLEGSGAFPPTQDTDGWGGGAYLGWSIADNLVFSANVLGTSLDTDVNGFQSFDSVRWQTSEALTYTHYSGTWRLAPSLTFAWSKEWQDGGAFANDQTIETIILTPAVQVGNSFSIGGASTVEPYLGAALDWSLRNKTVDEVIGTVFSDPNVDLRLQAGLNFAFGANAQLSLNGEVSGILLDDSTTYTGGANFAFQF
jgi:Autotransporter beta-domain